MYIPTMQTPAAISSACFTKRLEALAKLTNRPPVRRIARKLPLSPNVELHGWLVGQVLRPMWNAHFGVTP